MTPPANKTFVFRPIVVIAGGIATLVTILLPLLQVASWINGDGVWILWSVIALLLVVCVLLTARLTAMKMQLVGEQKTDEPQPTPTVPLEPQAQGRAATQTELPTKGESLPRPSLGALDQTLADHLYQFASNPDLLSMLAEFFSYQIPHGPVRLIEELSKLPVTRSAHDQELARHLRTLSETASAWLLSFLPLISTRGDYYTTRLDHHVSEAAYKEHMAATDKLATIGFKLHEKLLAYQSYYASL